jgi:hypothetical protein
VDRLREAGVGRLPLACLAAALAVALALSLGDAARFHGIDLRARVVSTRALLSGLEAYEVPWTPGTGEALLDPLRRHPGPGRSLNAPTLFLAYAPAAWLPYAAQRRLWFVADWLFFLGSAALLVPLVPRSRRGFFVGVVLVAFLLGHSWRLEVERGQYYGLLALLLAVELRVQARSAEGERGLGGLALGVAAGLRPSLLAVAAMLWLLGRRRTAAAAATVALALALVTLPLGGIATWRSALRTIERFRIATADPAYVDRAYPPALETPTSAEGLDLVSCLDTGAWELTWLHLLLWTSQTLTPIAPGSLLATERVLATGGLLALAAAAARLRSHPAARGAPMLVALTLTLDAELGLPSKPAYGELLLLPPLALAAAHWGGPGSRAAAALLLAPALAGLCWAEGAPDLGILRALAALALLNVALARALRSRSREAPLAPSKPSGGDAWIG